MRDPINPHPHPSSGDSTDPAQFRKSLAALYPTLMSYAHVATPSSKFGV